ncbi:MAG: MotB family protein [Hyphomicrobiaceae bacterium]|nr:MotB family protein [Hyphomicrobiaceae bacterium]
MSSESVSRNPAELPGEIVIIRRRSVEDMESSHGGIWKIAYADFMTAMMAFFLVMWLISATDKQTVSAVASYFNPVKLTDRIANPKGLHDMQSGARGKEDAPGESTSRNGASKGDPRAEGTFRPGGPEGLVRAFFAVVAEPATAEPWKKPESALRAARIAGEAFRDPFEPELRLLPARAEANAPLRLPDWQAGQQPDAQADSSPGLRIESSTAFAPAGARPWSGAEAADGADERDPAASRSPDRPAPPSADSAIEEEIRAALRGAETRKLPNLEVTSTPEGVLISLTDDLDFGMFAIASAEPRPELVAIMDRIAQVLRTHPGPLVVRGHTDGRPFRSQSYDNWRLSAARAHAAYFMLLRGGVDEQRFERIEGHADRSLKLAGEPEAAQNRRIEILLRKAHAS